MVIFVSIQYKLSLRVGPQLGTKPLSYSKFELSKLGPRRWNWKFRVKAWYRNSESKPWYCYHPMWKTKLFLHEYTGCKLQFVTIRNGIVMRRPASNNEIRNKNQIHFQSAYEILRFGSDLDTGRSINEHENGPSSNRQKKHLFWVGFLEVIILVYKNLDFRNLVADWLMIWSEFIWAIFRMKNEGMNLLKWTWTKSSTNQRQEQPWSKFL